MRKLSSTPFSPPLAPGLKSHGLGAVGCTSTMITRYEVLTGADQMGKSDRQLGQSALFRDGGESAESRGRRGLLHRAIGRVVVVVNSGLSSGPVYAQPKPNRSVGRVANCPRTCRNRQKG